MGMRQNTEFTGLTDWYLDTANLTLDPAFKNYFLQDPKDIDQRRFMAYRYFIDFYKAKHWDEQGEWNPAFGNKSLLDEEYNRRTWNLSRNIVKKLVSFLMKESWTTKLPEALEDIVDEDDDLPPTSGDALAKSLNEGPDDSQNTPLSSGGDEQDNTNSQQDGQDSFSDFGGPSKPKAPPASEGKNPIQEVLDQVWYANSRDTFNYKVAYMACITGDAFVRISYDPDFYAEGVGELRFDVLDSRTVLPFFDSQDRTKMIGCRVQYPIFQIQEDGTKKQVTYTEIHTPNNIVYLLDKQVQDILANPLGEMLVVHFKNEPLPFERFGTSDLYDLIVPQKEYNEKVSDLSEILAYHAAPITIIKGARIQTLEKGAQKVWGGIPPEGDVFNLDLPTGGAEAAASYIETLKQHMHEVGNVPEESLGSLQNVSNTSAAALHIQYQPLVERISEKQKCYGEGYQKMNELTLKFYEAANVIDIPDDIPPALRYRTIINWGDALPRDMSLMLADEATMIGLGIQSKKGALKDIGEENPDAKLREIEEESLRQAQLDFATMGTSGFGDPSAGPDGMGGAPGTAPGAEQGPKPQVAGALNAAKTNPNTHGAGVSNQAVKQSAQTSSAQNKTKKPGFP